MLVLNMSSINTQSGFEFQGTVSRDMGFRGIGIPPQRLQGHTLRVRVGIGPLCTRFRYE